MAHHIPIAVGRAPGNAGQRESILSGFPFDHQTTLRDKAPFLGRPGKKEKSEGNLGDIDIHLLTKCWYTMQGHGPSQGPQLKMARLASDHTTTAFGIVDVHLWPIYPSYNFRQL